MTMKISVGICTFNGQEYLRKQLNSILEQTLPVNEIVICDDGSNDATWTILQDYKFRYADLIQIKQNSENLKSIKNFEQVLSLCSGDIIFLSDQDDVWAANKVEEYISYFEAHPAINVLCSNGYIVDQKDSIVDAITIWDTPQILAKKNEKINYFYSICYCGNIATGATMAIRKEYLPHILPIPDSKDMHHDEWIALTASFQNSFVLLDKKLFYYRVHPDQQIGNISHPNTDRTIRKLYKRFSTSDYSLSSLKRRIKKAAITHNHLLNVKDNPEKDMMRKDISNTYWKLRKQLIKYHPISGRIVNILEKRRLK